MSLNVPVATFGPVQSSSRPSEQRMLPFLFLRPLSEGIFVPLPLSLHILCTRKHQFASAAAGQKKEEEKKWETFRSKTYIV